GKPDSSACLRISASSLARYTQNVLLSATYDSIHWMSGASWASTSFDLAAASLSCARSRLPTSGISRSMMNFLMDASCPLSLLVRAIGALAPCPLRAHPARRSGQAAALDRLAGQEAHEVRQHQDRDDDRDRLDRDQRHERRAPDIARPALAPVGQYRDRERAEQDGERQLEAHGWSSPHVASGTPAGSARPGQEPRLRPRARTGSVTPIGAFG